MNKLYKIVQEKTSFNGYIHIPDMFLGFVIGKKKVTQMRIERETGTLVTIPQSGSDNPLSVCGDSYESVLEALNKISSLVAIAREKAIFTHFLSIKSTTETVKTSFLNFKSSVLEQCSNEYGVNDRVFQKDYKLHMTICIVVLADKNEINNMNDVCKQFQNDNASLFASPIKVHLRGLESMNKDYKNVQVLYAKVEPGSDRDRLQTIADRMMDNLLDRGIILRREYDSVILHMTLMNISFANDNSRSPNHNDVNKVRPNTIDCSKIFEKFADWDFGEVCINEVELSRRHTPDEGSFYKNDGVMTFIGDELQEVLIGDCDDRDQ